MSTALYIVTRKKLRGVDLFVNGKAVAALDDDVLDTLCDQLGVATLSSFISQNPDELAEFLDGEDVEDAVELPAEQWFEPSNGLVTVGALIAHLQAHPAALPDAQAVLEDLREYDVVLRTLRDKKAMWHLAIDY